MGNLLFAKLSLFVSNFIVTPIKRCPRTNLPLLINQNPNLQLLSKHLFIKAPPLYFSFELHFYSTSRTKESARQKDENIRSSNICLISETGEIKGTFPLKKILSEMNRKEQVLIQVNDLFPPYCRIFSKKELYAKEKAIKKLNSVGVVKTKTFKISSNISPHDLQVKVNQCKKIFEKGDAVIFILLFPKREHPEKAQSILLPLYNKLEELIGESGKITKRFTIEDGVGTFTVQGNKVGAKQPD